MAKQKIVMKVSMSNPKKRSKALQIVASHGVTSMSLEGDNVVVEGDGIDSVTLTRALRKGMGFAQLVSVAEKDEKKEEKSEFKISEWPSLYPPLSIQVMEPYYRDSPSCTIM